MKRKNIYHDGIFGRQAGIVPEHAFVKRICAHSSLIGRLALDKTLRGHQGCVNTIAFSHEGSVVVSGSDDCQLRVWDVETGNCLVNKDSGHRDNIFSARFVPFTNENEVVSAAADGQVRWNALSLNDTSNGSGIGGGGGSGGSGGGGKLLARHDGRAHRLCLIPRSYSCFMSCGEDGQVFSFDLRGPRKTLVLTLTDDDRDILPIYAMSVNPVESNYFILGGTSNYVYLYDARSPDEAVARFAPKHMRRESTDHVTGTAYHYSGKEFVATYNDELIYKFDAVLDAVREENDNGGSAGASSSPSSASASPAQAAAAAAAAAGSSRSYKRRVGVRAMRMNGEGSSSGSDGLAAAAGGGGAGGGAATAASVRAAASGKKEDDERQDEEEEDEDGNDEEGDRRKSDDRKEGHEDEAAEEGENGYRCKYTGQRNDRTVKQVNFFGPRSEYVVSGSDCGHIFIWDTKTTELRQLLAGDRRGAVNCLESHPTLPILATSGLEHDAKLWRPIRPSSLKPTELKGHRDVSAADIMARNARERDEPRHSMPWTSMLLRQALSSNVNASNVRAILSIVNSLNRRRQMEASSDEDNEDNPFDILDLASDDNDDDEDSSENDGSNGSSSSSSSSSGRDASQEDEEEEEAVADQDEEEEEEDDDFIGPRRPVRRR